MIGYLLAGAVGWVARGLYDRSELEPEFVCVICGCSIDGTHRPTKTGGRYVCGLPDDDGDCTEEFSKRRERGDFDPKTS